MTRLSNRSRTGLLTLLPALACISCANFNGASPHASFVLGEGGHPFPITEKVVGRAKDQNKDVIFEITKAYLGPQRDIVICFQGVKKGTREAQRYHFNLSLPPLRAVGHAKGPCGCHVVNVPRRAWKTGTPDLADLESRGFTPIPYNNSPVGVRNPAEKIQSLRLPDTSRGGVCLLTRRSCVFVISAPTDPVATSEGHDTCAVVFRTRGDTKSALLYYPLVPFAAAADTAYTAGSAAGFATYIGLLVTGSLYTGAPLPL